MKPTSPLSLLLFLSLTTAVPIPSKLSKECLHYTNCDPWLREILACSSSGKNDHTPPTRLPPHFPAHQLHPASSSPESHRQIEEEAFNNAPLSPPKDQKPTLALSSGRPLQSSYLLSLSNPALKNPPQGEPQSTSTSDPLPSKPTAALPTLREEDVLRYWATTSTDSPVPVDKKEGQDVISDGTAKKCGDYSKLTGSAYLRVGQPMITTGEYSDLLVVGIVVLFLAAVAVLEAVEYCGDLRSAICGNRRRRQRRGEIFLEDDESVAFIAKKPFCLQPAPPSKHQSSLASIQEIEPETEKDGVLS